MVTIQMTRRIEGTATGAINSAGAPGAWEDFAVTVPDDAEPGTLRRAALAACPPVDSRGVTCGGACVYREGWVVRELVWDVKTQGYVPREIEGTVIDPRRAEYTKICMELGIDPIPAWEQWGYNARPHWASTQRGFAVWREGRKAAYIYEDRS